MGSLIPDETLIYEHANGIIYARYAAKPDIPRWEIGRTSPAADLFGYYEFCNLRKLAETNPALKKQLDKLIDLYYLYKEDK
jgi:hypothetical protein